MLGDMYSLLPYGSGICHYAFILKIFFFFFFFFFKLLLILCCVCPLHFLKYFSLVLIN